MDARHEKQQGWSKSGQNKAFCPRPRALTALLFCLFLLSQPTPLHAGCGCDKPPPAPAAVIPPVAFPGMSVTLLHDSFQVGQTWTVVFRSGAAAVSVPSAVVAKRALADPQSPPTLHPQLIVPVPVLPLGPTQIEVFAGTDSFVVPAESFTLIGKPVVASELTGKFSVKHYVTGIGADGTLYISLGGLNNVCEPMEFNAYAKSYPLRFVDGAVVILNRQGFLIDAFNQQSADHFSIQRGDGANTDLLNYFRHSFVQYCADHQPGGPKEVDPQDSNWHLDGTAHTDYSTLILAISGRLDEQTIPQAGEVSFELRFQTKVTDRNDIRAQEKGEEAGMTTNR
jgi:hypothetical protein